MSEHQQGNNERNENMDIEGQLPSKVVESVPKLIFKPLVLLFRGWYGEILVFYLAIAVSVDPLFLYVPVIKEDKKCIGLNKVWWITTFVSRSVIDVVFLLEVVRKLVYNPHLHHWARLRRHLWGGIRSSFQFVLPIPQVVMPIIFSEMRRTKSSNITILSSLILLQYGPRVFKIYRFRKKTDSLWLKASSSLFLYILAGHVLGAFWYFFSAQRLTACWHKAYEIHGCGFECSFDCDHGFRNLTLLDDFCPIDTPNPSTFDFGIFLEARRSGILESTGFLQKVFYCFSWGMRNLSSFGSNLQPSGYIWENTFTLGISISGLLLFLYFMGNLQVYMQDGSSESIKKSDVGNLLIELEKLNEQLPSVVDKLKTESGQLYKQCIASKSEKDAAQPKSDGAVV